MTALQQQCLIVAKRYIGATENQGPNRGTVVSRFQSWFGAWALGQPWCAMFVTYSCDIAAKELGIKSPIIKSASCSQIYAWARKNGRLIADPEPGCIFLVRNGGEGDSDGRADRGKTHIHTGFVHDVEDDGVLLCIEGNFGNKCTWHRRRNRHLTFVRI